MYLSSKLTLMVVKCEQVAVHILVPLPSVAKRERLKAKAYMAASKKIEEMENDFSTASEIEMGLLRTEIVRIDEADDEDLEEG